LLHGKTSPAGVISSDIKTKGREKRNETSRQPFPPEEGEKPVVDSIFSEKKMLCRGKKKGGKCDILREGPRR